MQQDEIRTTLSAAHAAGSLDGALQVLVEAQSSIAPVGEQIVLRRQFAITEPGVATGVAEELSTLPAVIQDAAIRALARRGWKAPIPGVKILELDLQTTADARLLRIMPKAATPKHTHEGSEYALVLRGVLDDSVGQYHPGEISFADATITHTPRAGDDSVLWLLVVRYGRMRLTGVMGALQRLFGR